MSEETETPEEEPKEKTTKESVRESLMFVVDMMNNGDVNPRHVYPRGRYQGD